MKCDEKTCPFPASYREHDGKHTCSHCHHRYYDYNFYKARQEIKRIFKVR